MIALTPLQWLAVKALAALGCLSVLSMAFVLVTLFRHSPRRIK